MSFRAKIDSGQKHSRDDCGPVGPAVLAHASQTGPRGGSRTRFSFTGVLPHMNYCGQSRLVSATLLIPILSGIFHSLDMVC